MSSDVPNPGYDRPWPRHRPVFTILALLGAVLVGTAAFAWQFKTRWTPLQRYYFPSYLRSAHLASSRNPYLRPGGTYRVLLIVYPHTFRMALDSEVAAVPSSGNESSFRLSQAAIANGARSLRWQSLRLDDDWLHGFLARWIYGGRSLFQLCRDCSYASLLALVLLLPLGIRQDLRESRKRRLGRPLRGVNLATRTEFHRSHRYHTGIGLKTTNCSTRWERIFLSATERSLIRVARQHEMQHFLLVGDSGVGKSSLIRQLLIQIRERDETAIVYDPAREFLPQFLEPGRGDMILNPLDARMPYWSPSDELLHPTEADAIAKSLFPDRQREIPFFVEGPRTIFAHLLKYRPTLDQLCHWLATPDPEIYRRVAGTPIQSIISQLADNQREGVLGVLERASRVLSLLPATAKTGRRWSATQWIEKRQGWLFVTSTHQTRVALNPLISLWLDLLILRLTGQTSGDVRPVWVVLDEVPALEHLPTLPLALVESRKSNTRMVLGLQSRSQLEVRYGKEAEAMLSQPRTKVFLRTSEACAADWVSKSIGEVESEHLREGRTSGEFGARRSQSDAFERRIEPAVLPSEITNLPDLEGYLRMPGHTLKLSFALFPKEKHHPDLIPADIPALALPPEPPEDQWLALGPQHELSSKAAGDTLPVEAQ